MVGEDGQKVCQILKRHTDEGGRCASTECVSVEVFGLVVCGGCQVVER